jgi:hypothetical protein
VPRGHPTGGRVVGVGLGALRASARPGVRLPADMKLTRLGIPSALTLLGIRLAVRLLGIRPVLKRIGIWAVLALVGIRPVLTLLGIWAALMLLGIRRVFILVGIWPAEGPPSDEKCRTGRRPRCNSISCAPPLPQQLCDGGGA